jgi:hypothetical protein
MALWSRGLEGRIVTLELQGQQSKMADKMETGSFFTVKHMRLIERVMGMRRVVGRIGGPDRLIHKLNMNNPNEELETLLGCVGFVILVGCLVCLPCRVTGGRINGKEKLELQDERKASLLLPAC